MAQSQWQHPCLSCGACCAYFRVVFYWREAEASDSLHPVPQDYFQEQDSHLRIMNGTEKKHNKGCHALKGKIGKQVSCSIYENRPTPCREFEASFENGVKNKRCDEARLGHGLKPLRPEDWNYPPSKPFPAPLTKKEL